MSKVLNFTAEQILEIHPTAPEKIFSSPELFDIEHKRLRRFWSPDHNNHEKANDVFDRIQKLSQTASERIESNSWNGQSVLKWVVPKGSTYQFRYHTYKEFDLGSMYIGHKKIVYVLDDADTDLFHSAVDTISKIHYKSNKFENEFKPTMPNVLHHHHHTNIGNVLVVAKPPGMIQLDEILSVMTEGKIDPKHVGWILSALYNVAVFLDMIGIVHNNISTETVFVDTEQHTVAILGGWWYSVPTGSALMALPKSTYSLLSQEDLENKTSNSVYDRVAIKALGIVALGDLSKGSKLLFDKTIPQPLIKWLHSPSTTTKNALSEFSSWDQVLIDSFGERKFIKFGHDISQLI